MPDTTAPRHTFGPPDTECRYLVLLNAQFIGHVFRWHRAWIATPAGLETEVRVSAGSTGKDAAARYHCDEFNAGRIAPHQEAPKASHAEKGSGPAPLLHPRMDKPHNRPAALTAVRGLSDLQWTPPRRIPRSG
ncbi:hypothetical protein [Streptomyces griseus]|uniref:hypothetical protein n=1 Tax=Streptomyces griseus TaxID=1911 RepID=UPI0037A391D3